MLIYFLIQLPVIFINALTSWFPHVETLPMGLDAILTDGFNYFFFLTALIPPLAILWEGFFWVITFKITMRLLRLVPFIGRMFN